MDLELLVGRNMEKTTILSVENTFGWSWGIIIRKLIEKLDGKYDIVRVVRDLKNGISPDMVNHFDVLFLQNVDNVRLINGNKAKAVCRMGGMRTMRGDPKRFDSELSQVGTIVATNTELFEIAERNCDFSYLVPNGINLNEFKPSTEKPDRKFTIGFCGNIMTAPLADYKGYHYVDQARLTLFTETAFLSFTYAHNQIPHEQMVEDFYHRIDCLVLPSINEGCNNVITEALACGVPVLITKVGYHGETLEHGKNCLFIERNHVDISDKIRMLMEDKALQETLSKNGRLFVEQNQDIDKIAHEFDLIFGDMIRRSKNG